MTQMSLVVSELLEAEDPGQTAAERATFTAMADGTAEDYARIKQAADAFHRELPSRLLAYLSGLKGSFGGFLIDRYDHSLQSATRALRDGRDEEYVVCALLHDIGDPLASHNHADLAAVVLQPFVSEENAWMVQHHGVFQGYYFMHHLGLDRNLREQYRGHPAFELTAQFCHLHDQNAFDPGYDTLPLEAFEPMVRRLMERPKRSIYARPEPV